VGQGRAGLPQGVGVHATRELRGLAGRRIEVAGLPAIACNLQLYALRCTSCQWLLPGPHSRAWWGATSRGPKSTTSAAEALTTQPLLLRFYLAADNSTTVIDNTTNIDYYDDSYMF